MLLKVDEKQGKGNERMTEQSQFVEAMKQHHRNCYRREEFRWLWRPDGLNHTGVWAFGGNNKDVPPSLVWVKLTGPTLKTDCGWYCYIGPIPEFSNTIYYDEHSEGTQVNG